MNKHRRFFLISIISVGTLLYSAEPSIVSSPNTPARHDNQPIVTSPKIDQQTDMMLCWKHIEILDRLLDTLECSLRNEAIKVIRNPQKVKAAETREQAEKWIITLINEIKAIRTQLSKPPVNVLLLQTYYASLIHVTISTINAFNTKFNTDVLKHDDAQITKNALDTIVNTVKALLDKKTPETIQEEITKLLAGMPPQLTVLLQAAELKPYLMLDALLEKLELEQTNLAHAIRDYGLSRFNRAARQLERNYKKISATPTAQWIKTGALSLGAAVIGLKYGLPLIGNIFSPFFNKNTHEDFAGKTTGQLVYRLAESTGNFIWTPTSRFLNSTKTKLYQGWNWAKGEEFRETIDGLEVLREEDCEGRELPPIGIKHVLDTILGNVEGGLTRQEQGDPTPFQDTQKGFILTGKSGAGKTFAMQQLKIRFAKLNRKLQRKIVYQALTPIDIARGLLPMFIEAAKQKDIALILWIDELHLTKPMKDGDPATLYDFLTSEVINKQNLPIWIICASNEPGRFDSALVRAGRFEIINLPDLTFEERMEFIAFYAQQEGLSLSEKVVRLLASLTAGCPPALIMKLLLSAKQHGKLLTEEYLFDAILRLVVRTTPGFESLAPTAQHELATYLIGQAMVKLASHKRLPDESPLDPDPVLLVTAHAIQTPIKELAAFTLGTNVVTNANLDKPRSFGKVVMNEPREGFPYSATTLGKEEEVKMLLAGSCAQQELLGYTNLDYQKDDIAHAHRNCLELELNGLALEQLSRARQNAIKDAAEARLNELRSMVLALIKSHLPALKLATSIMISNPLAPYLFGFELRNIMENPEAVKAMLEKAQRAATEQQAKLLPQDLSSFPLLTPAATPTPQTEMVTAAAA